MSDGFLYWYQRGWSRQLAADRIVELEAAGFSLVHHVNGRIAAISSDFETIGEQGREVLGRASFPNAAGKEGVTGEEVRNALVVTRSAQFQHVRARNHRSDCEPWSTYL